MKTKARIYAAALLGITALPASGTVINLVHNPGFEDGALGWTQSQFTFAPNPLWSRSGPGTAYTTCHSLTCLSRSNSVTQAASVSQMLSTTAGASYEFSFWARSFTDAGDVAVYWDGALLTKQAVPSGPMYHFIFPNVLATSNFTMLEVRGRNYDDAISFDDFLVTPMTVMPGTPPIPEANTYLMMLAGLGVIGGYGWLRRRSA